MLWSSAEAERRCRHSERKVKGQRQQKVGRRQQQDFAKEPAFQHLPEVVMQDALLLLRMGACPAKAPWKREASQFSRQDAPKAALTNMPSAHFHCPAAALDTLLSQPPGSAVNHHPPSLSFQPFFLFPPHLVSAWDCLQSALSQAVQTPKQTALWVLPGVGLIPSCL